MFVGCEKWVETRTDCYIDPSFFLDHSSTSFASGLRLLHRGSLRAQSLLSGAGSHFGILAPTDSNRPGPLLYYFLSSTIVHLLPLFFCLFTQVHLLIDSSVEGQYIIIWHKTSDGEVPIMLELWGIWSTNPMPSLPAPIWRRVVAPYKALFMG